MFAEFRVSINQSPTSSGSAPRLNPPAISAATATSPPSQPRLVDFRVSANQSPTSRDDAGRATASPRRLHRHHSTEELHHTYRHHIGLAGNAAMREARCRLKHDVESNHIDSPCIWVRGEACLPAGPLPSFIDALTLEDALHDLPQGARLACIKCVAAWRMGHLDAKFLLSYLRSVAGQSSALQQCVALVPPRAVSNLRRRHSSASARDTPRHSETEEDEPQERELLSEEEMSSMLCGSV